MIWIDDQCFRGRIRVKLLFKDPSVLQRGQRLVRDSRSWGAVDAGRTISGTHDILQMMFTLLPKAARVQTLG